MTEHLNWFTHLLNQWFGSAVLALLSALHITPEHPSNPMRVGIRDILEDSIEHHPDRYLPVVGSTAIFVLMSNAISVFPTLDSPTGNPSVPLACAILTFAYYNWVGLR